MGLLSKCVNSAVVIVRIPIIINESMDQCFFINKGNASHRVGFIISFLRIAKYSALCRFRDLTHGFILSIINLSLTMSVLITFTPNACIS